MCVSWSRARRSIWRTDAVTLAGGVASSVAGAGDTIAALATAPGRGAIAVIRVSGPEAHGIVRRHASPWPAEPRRATLCSFRGGDGGKLDSVIVTTFAAPHSFTGEDSVEISSHGGVVAPTLILASLLQSGAREAAPGEFTRRAVLNGKLDLVQAEAIGDLIDASSRAMHLVALRQLDGGLSRSVAELRGMLVSLEALIAYDIDFPGEDDGPVPAGRVAHATDDALAALDALLATAPAGELIREGALVVIAGPPNVGKSSLFNALLGRARAIVADVPGTTRDAIEAVVETGEFPLRLVDTAGLRDTSEMVERLGIEVSERYLASAHVVLACGDSADVAARVARDVAALTAAQVIVVRTKADLQVPTTELAARQPSPEGATYDVAVSAALGWGLTELLDVIGSALRRMGGAPEPDTPILVRERHHRGVERARDELAAFATAWNEAKLPAPVAAVHLREAVRSLEEMIGAVSTDDVLDRLFSSFCVGK